MKLYELVTEQSAVAWQRVRIANFIAETGQEWAKVIDTYNSGTYNNQYMVIDTKLFKPKEALSPGLLWVVEQIPGLVVSRDVTATLERGYWPSYNVPYFREVYDRSGYPEFVLSQSARGEEYAAAVEGLNYQLAPRAKIFRRDAGSVDSIESMTRVMRSNDYMHDPYSGGSPWGAICSRGDLAVNSTSAAGCYDTKVSDFFFAKHFQSWGVNGPTAESLPPFQWSTSAFDEQAHYGMPDIFNYKMELQEPVRIHLD